MIIVRRLIVLNVNGSLLVSMLIIPHSLILFKILSFEDL